MAAVVGPDHRLCCISLEVVGPQVGTQTAPLHASFPSCLRGLTSIGSICSPEWYSGAWPNYWWEEALITSTIYMVVRGVGVMLTSF